MSNNRLGTIVMPTGSGKTITMIQDAKSVFKSGDNNIVIVAPTIALTNQLSREFLQLIGKCDVMHVHSGETGHFTTTHPADIYGWCALGGKNLIFTTYHSLHRIVKSGVDIHTCFFDESHNSVKTQWFDDVKSISQSAQRCYYFTASPKYSVCDKPGQNDTSVFGNVICDVPVTEMIQNNYIVPPVLRTIASEQVVSGRYHEDVDINKLLECLQTKELNNVLVSCKNSTQLYHIISSERFTDYCDQHGFDVYHITSKYGCYINEKKVRRDVMMSHMRNNTGKFIVFHINVLCEGINLPKLDSLILLRKLNTIQFIQSIGRVLRLSEGKTEGNVILPTYSSYLKKTEKSVMNMMTRIYQQGETPIQIIRR